MGTRHTFITALSRDQELRKQIRKDLTEAIEKGHITSFGEGQYGQEHFYFHGVLKNFINSAHTEITSAFLSSDINVVWISDERKYGLVGYDTWGDEHEIKD